MAEPVDAEAFELALRRGLPRGLERPSPAAGRERGLTARWLAADELVGERWEQQAGGLILGRRGGRVIGANDDRHMLTIAGSRAGKGVSLIIPNLIVYEGAALVIDPKGENAARTAAQRGAGSSSGKEGLGQKVFVLDPYGESGLPTNSFNPLDKLDANSPDVVEDIALFADALITHEEKGDRHWTEAAQALLRALILLVLADPAFVERRNLVTVRKLLILSDKAIDAAVETDFERRREKARLEAEEYNEDTELAARGVRRISKETALIKLLLDADTSDYGYICTGLGEQLTAMGDKERGSILSTARTQTQWLDSPAMQNVLKASDVPLRELASEVMTIYLCLPASRMATHARWLRLLVMLAIASMERSKKRPKRPVLFVLDEFAVLGYMQSVETAAGLMAGFGVKLWPILQNIGQLKRYYGNTWQTFIANAGVITAFNVTDDESLRVLSSFLGNTNITSTVEGQSSRSSELAGTPTSRDDRKQVPLLAPNEMRLVLGRGTNRILVLNVESEPVILQRFVYHAQAGRDAELFAGRYEPDPNYVTQP